MDVLVFLTLILLTRFSQRGSLLSGGGQWADHVPRGCSRLIGISKRWGWTRLCLGGGQTEAPQADARPIPIPLRCRSTCCNHEARGQPIGLLHS